MKVKVLKAFRDKHDNVIRNIGDEIEINEARLKEIDEAGEFVEVIKVEEAPIEEEVKVEVEKPKRKPRAKKAPAVKEEVEEEK
jgi:hypothetical protein